MKNPFLLLFCFFCIIYNASAQSVRPKNFVRCGTTEYYKKLFQAHPELKRKFNENQRKIAQLSKNRAAAKMEDFIDTIPLVVHVVASSAIQAQVTNAIIQSQVDVLNEDYQGKNADSTRIPAAFKPKFGKSRILFKLAATNMYGEPTNGINRIVSTKTYTESTFDDVKFNSLGGSNAWDPRQYLNIWIVSFGTTGVLGISVFPGDPRDLTYHGFVADYRAFGRGASYLYKEFNKGRTTTHELGHFFNLQHIWADDNGACTGSDFPDNIADDDTPNQADATYGNPDPKGVGKVITDKCSPTAPGIMYQNYMDYTDDSALVMFTKAQQQRMEDALSTSPDRFPLLISTTYQTPKIFVKDSRIRIIESPISTSPLCNPSIAPQIVLRNSGTEALTSVKIIVVLNNGAPVTVNWTGNLAPYTETTITLPVITGNVGTNILSVYTTDPNGGADENVDNDESHVTFEVLGSVILSLKAEETFSSTTFPPPGWSVKNDDKKIGWQRHPTIGKNAPGSAWFNSWNNEDYGSIDDLVTPNYSFKNIDSIFLHFNLAAATYSDPTSTETEMDTLSVLVSKDCGNTFTTVYKKWGSALQTTLTPDKPYDEEFFPTANLWRRDSVNLGTVLGNTEEQFQIYFRVTSNFENNIFLDDIELKTKSLPELLKEQGYLISPNPFKTNFSIWHYKPPTALQYVNIYTSTGQLVWSKKYTGNAEMIITVNLQDLASGVYIVNLGYSDDRKKVSQRILKY